MKEINSLWRSLCAREDQLVGPSKKSKAIRVIFFNFLENDPQGFGDLSSDFKFFRDNNPVQARDILQRLAGQVLEYNTSYNKLKSSASELKSLSDAFELEEFREIGDGSFLKRAHLHNLYIIEGMVPADEIFESAKIEALPLPVTP